LGLGDILETQEQCICHIQGMAHIFRKGNRSLFIFHSTGGSELLIELSVMKSPLPTPQTESDAEHQDQTIFDCFEQFSLT